MKHKESILILISGAKDIVDLENHANWKLYKRLTQSFKAIFIINRSNEFRIYNSVHNVGIISRYKFINNFKFLEKLIDIFICLRNIKRISKRFDNCRICYLASEPTFGGVVAFFNKLFFKKEYIVEHQGILLDLPAESFGRVNAFFIKYISIFTTIFSYKIRVVSKAIYKSLIFNQIKKDKITLIYPRYNSDIFKYFDKTNDPQGKIKNILFVGRLIKSKGLIFLIKALKNQNQFHLNVIGDGYLMEDLKIFCKINKIFNISFQGKLSYSKIYDFMKSSDLLVAPSLDEGLGRQVIEAKASGLPVYATNVGGLNDLYEQGLIDEIFKPASSESILELLERPIPKRYKVNEDSLKNFNFEYNMQQYINFLKA